MKTKALGLLRLLLVSLVVMLVMNGGWASAILSTADMESIQGGCYPTYPCVLDLPCDLNGQWGCDAVGDCPIGCNAGGATTSSCAQAPGENLSSCTPGGSVPGGCGKAYKTVARITGSCVWSDPGGSCDKQTATGTTCPDPM